MIVTRAAQLFLLLVVLLTGGCGETPKPTLAASKQALTSGAHLLYLNFEGAVIQQSGIASDAPRNISFLGAGTIPAFGGDAATRTQIAALVREAFKAYDLTIVTSRPASGDYSMGVIGGYPTDIGQSAGTPAVSPLDCGSVNPRDIFFVFADYMRARSTAMLAERVAQSTCHEAGHSFGLPHSNDACDLMVAPFDAPCPSGFARTFLDKEMGLPDIGCGTAMTNSHQLLLKALGPASTAPPLDEDPPQVTILSPADGARIGPQLVVEAEITDNPQVARAELYVDGVKHSELSSAPYRFSLTLAAGQHTLVVRGYDAAGNEGTASVTVTVEDTAPVGADGSAAPNPAGPTAVSAEGSCALAPSSTSSPLPVAFLLAACLLWRWRCR